MKRSPKFLLLALAALSTGSQALAKELPSAKPEDVGMSSAKLAKVEKPTNAIINSICGWMLVGVKYLAWLGGMLIVLPLALVEILVGLREPDSAEFV